MHAFESYRHSHAKIFFLRNLSNHSSLNDPLCNVCVLFLAKAYLELYFNNKKYCCILHMRCALISLAVQTRISISARADFFQRKMASCIEMCTSTPFPANSRVPSCLASDKIALPSVWTNSLVFVAKGLQKNPFL